MFNGKKYKADALLQLKKRWKTPCIITLIGIVVVAGFNTLSELSFLAEILAVCVCGIVSVAQIHVYLKIAGSGAVFASDADLDRKKIAFSDFTDGFDCWISSLLGTLWFCLWTWLWSLLFLIPGIVKAISYSMMFFVIAENPEIGVKKAMNISKIMTAGHKAELFCLFMSFFGWFLLCVATCGIGFIWLCPYFSTAMANAYFDLKLMSFESKKLKPADFC